MINQDPHLYNVRMVHRLRVGGKPWAEVAKQIGVSIPTARKYLDEYHERRANRTLFNDVDGARDVDIYAHPVHMRAMRPRTSEKA